VGAALAAIIFLIQKDFAAKAAPTATAELQATANEQWS
jgi:hypothetical protein